MPKPNWCVVKTSGGTGFGEYFHYKSNAVAHYRSLDSKDGAKMLFKVTKELFEVTHPKFKQMAYENVRRKQELGE